MKKLIIVVGALFCAVMANADGNAVNACDGDCTPYARTIKALHAKEWERFCLLASQVAKSQWDYRIKAGLGHCHRKGIGGMSRDGKIVFALLSESVRHADEATTQADSNVISRAMLEMGICHHAGLGTATNHVEAVKWYRKAAERGYADAQFCLGACCHHGVGVGQDIGEALRWYRAAVANGYGAAQKSIDKIIRERNKDIFVKFNEAMRLAGDPGTGTKDKKRGYALLCEVVTHEKDDGLDEDARECVGGALAALGTYCTSGIPGLVQKDPAKAFDFYRRAANFNNPVAQYNVGVCHERGDGVAKDRNEALKWYRKAFENGYENARKAIETLEAQMRKN